MLRLEAIGGIDKEEISVLDCFHGYGRLWAEVKKRSGRKINVLGLEKDKAKKSPFDVVYGDNEKLLPSIDVSMYDVIDIDAFGDAYHYIKAILPKAKPGAVMIYTQITVGMGGIHGAIINETVGEKIYRKCRCLFTNKFIEIFEGALFKIGIEEINQIEKKRKLYGYIVKKS